MIGAGEGRREPPPGGVELLLLAAGGLLGVVWAVVWGGARLAAVFVGGSVRPGMSAVLTAAARLFQTPGDPAEAWGAAASALPGPVMYWACTAVVACIVGAAVAGGVWAWRRWWSPARSRFGVPTEARVARPRDVRPLTVADTVPPSGRMLLGRMAPRGPLLATEDRERHPLGGRRSARVQGDRASVALIGPTRSGKTILAAAGIIGWDGPVVALSVKRDLYDTTASARAQRGEIAVFDPSAVTGLTTARWTPLRDVTTTSGALRAGRALAQAIPRQGVSGGDFWASHGETLTGAYMAIAGLSQLLPAEGSSEPDPLTMGRLAAWVFTHVGIRHPTVHSLVRRGLTTNELEVRLLAHDVYTKLMAFEDEDPRIRASIYATARLAFEAWVEPSVAHSASLDPRATYHSEELWDRTPRYIDLDWLMAGDEGRANTLYLAAPSTEFSRLAPALGGLLGDLREQIHAWDIAGRRLDKPLLILIDEAGQLGLQWLPEEVSTIAGLGGLIVTGWQSRAQINHAFGSLADAVLGGHRSKIIFNGTDDLATLEYLARVAGTEHVTQRGWSADAGSGRRTVSESPQREDLVPAHVVRQLGRQEAILLHGTLPPIHLKVVRWWEDRHLAALVPTDERGRPLPPPEVDTCPLVDAPRGGVSPVLDPAIVRESLSHLPRPRSENGPPGRRDDAGPRRVPRSGSQSAAAGQLTLTLDRDAEPATAATEDGSVAAVAAGRNRVAGHCERCGAAIAVGAGTTARFGGREVVLCADPPCGTSRTSESGVIAGVTPGAS